MSEINEVQVTLTANETTETTGWPWPRFPRSDDPSVGVDQRTYDNLVRYTKYASGAYQLLCPRPMGNTLIVQVSANVVTRRLLNLKGVNGLTPHLSVPGYCHFNERVYRQGRQTGRIRHRVQGVVKRHQHPSWYVPSMSAYTLTAVHSGSGMQMLASYLCLCRAPDCPH